MKLDTWFVPYKQGKFTSSSDRHLKVRRCFGFKRTKKNTATNSF